MLSRKLTTRFVSSVPRGFVVVGEAVVGEQVSVAGI